MTASLSTAPASATGNRDNRPVRGRFAVPRDELTARRERQLFERCRRGDADAREALVERFMPLASSLARRYEHSGESFEDLMQVACLGLVKALDRFDLDRGLSFSSYAVPTITGEIKRYFRDHTWSIHVPRGLNELALRLDGAISEHVAEHGRQPTTAQLCAKLGVGEEQVLEALQARHARRSASLDAPIGSDDDHGMTVGDGLASESAAEEYASADARILLAPLLAELAPRTREVLRLRYEEDLTQQKIGEIVGVSQMQVSRIIRASLAQLNASAC